MRPIQGLARGLVLPALLAGAAACGPSTLPSPRAASGEEAAPAPVRRMGVAAPGRVEGASEVVEVGAAADGVVGEVLVREGQRVAAGDVLARLVCHDLEARVQSTRAAAEAARQALHRVLRGHRKEERAAAAAATAAADAVLAQARQHNERIEQLADGVAVVSRNDLSLARRDLSVAQARYEAAVEEERLVNAPPLPEEVARAEADARSAEAQAREAAARLAKCTVTAPIAGTVLRRHVNPGELVTLVLSRPIVSLADTSTLRVRAEVDERDVGRVWLGQPATVTADGLEDVRLSGRVTRLGVIMGRKRVRSGDPAEKSDRDVQEVLVDLDGRDARLVVGLRVTVLFAPEPGPASR